SATTREPSGTAPEVGTIPAAEEPLSPDTRPSTFTSPPQATNASAHNEARTAATGRRVRCFRDCDMGVTSGCEGRLGRVHSQGLRHRTTTRFGTHAKGARDVVTGTCRLTVRAENALIPCRFPVARVMGACALSDRARLSARLLRLQAQVRSRRWVVGEYEDLKRSPRGDHRASDVAAPGTEGLSDCRNWVRITAPLASVVCRPRLCPVV